MHLDGVPYRLLESAIAAERMPFLSALVRSGAYHLDAAFWGSPASTPCFQAGVLYGLRHPNLPAYSWYDRELGRTVRMNVPADACAIEQRLVGQTSSSLLEGGGTAYLALFGAMAHEPVCMTSLADWSHLLGSLVRNARGLSGASRRGAWSFLHTLVKESFITARDVVRWAEQLRDWRHEREFMMNRFFLCSLAWSLAHSRALVDMVRGVPVIYLVFGNYDEISHRRGPTSPQALSELYRVDHQLAELYAVARMLDAPYDVVILTDHGHVDSEPIERRIGHRLGAWLGSNEPAHLSAEVERGLLDGRRFVPASPVQHRDEPELVEAGNFAHVYLSRGRKPLEAMDLLRTHRHVLARAVSQPDIGIIAVRRGDSAVAIIRGGVYGPRELHASPLSSEFSRAAVADLLRELPHMPTAGDLVLYGESHQPGGTVGFAWEFGSHGGLTHIETDSFVMWPATCPLDLRGLTHVTELYEKLSEVYRDGRPSPSRRAAS